MIFLKAVSLVASIISAGLLSITPITLQDHAFLINDSKKTMLVKKGRVSTLLVGPGSATNFIYIASCPSIINHDDFIRSEQHQPNVSGFDGVKCLFGDYQREDEKLGIKRLFVCSLDEEIINQASRKFQNSLK